MLPTHLRDHALSLDQPLVEEALSFWQWLVPAGCRPLVITRFGDWFLEGADSGLLFLDLLEGALKHLSTTAGDLQEASSVTRFADELSVDWVEVCHRQGMLLGPGQCYGWKIHPVIGGPLSSANIQPFGFRVYQSLNAQLHQQLRAQPGGGRVTGFSITE